MLTAATEIRADFTLHTHVCVCLCVKCRKRKPQAHRVAANQNQNNKQYGWQAVGRARDRATTTSKSEMKATQIHQNIHGTHAYTHNVCITFR